jgi:hypothetical protein
MCLNQTIAILHEIGSHHPKLFATAGHKEAAKLFFASTKLLRQHADNQFLINISTNCKLRKPFLSN